ncbi:MAG TPA: L,D-transpeptidase family protein [Blastocatellia bacterium]|nr:L,D-transpeptidase family protein [Blastocatellia bacterium]
MELAIFESRRFFLLRSLQAIAASVLYRRSASVNGLTAVQAKLRLLEPAIIVIKSKRVLELYSSGRLIKKYRVGLGLSPEEDKVRAGDRRTPEGEFYICLKNPRSQFYLSLQLSYPNAKHAARGLRDGLITPEQYHQTLNALNRKRVPPQNTRLGGELFIHGNGSQNDWTWGCVALDDGDMRELYDAISIGTPVTIKH